MTRYTDGMKGEKMDNTVDGLIQQAMAEAKTGNKPKAKNLLTDALKIDRKDARIWYLLSQILDDVDEKINCLEYAQRLQPDNPQIKAKLDLLKRSAPLPELSEIPSNVPATQIKSPSSQTPTFQIPPKKKSSQGIWIIIAVLAVVAGICLCVAALSTGNSTPTTTMNVEEQISTAKKIPYDELARNTENHIGEIVTYRGKVAQVIEQFGSKMGLRVEVTEGDYGIWDDLVWVNYTGPRLLQGDIIQFWGRVEGRYSYTTVLGANVTIPEITALKLVR